MKNDVYDILRTLIRHLECSIDEDGHIYDMSKELKYEGRPIVLTRGYVKGTYQFTPHTDFKMSEVMVDLLTQRWRFLEIPYIKQYESEKLGYDKFELRFLDEDGNIIDEVISKNPNLAKTLLVYKVLDPYIDLEELEEKLA